MGLAAGRYSGRRRPDLKRTPHALQRVFGPIGPSRHCGVFVTSQCKHLLTSIGCREVDFFVSLKSESHVRFIFFFSLFLPGSSVRWLSDSDSEPTDELDPREVEEVEDTKGNVKCALKADARLRLLRPRFTRKPSLGLIGTGFAAEQVLLLSSTDTGLEVWNRIEPLTSVDSLCRVTLLLEDASVTLDHWFS